MHFPSVVLSLSAMAAGAANAAVLRRADPHIADFRSFGEVGCDKQNQGVWTFTQSQLTGCKSFASFSADPIKSILLSDVNDGCSLTLYTDDQCTKDAVATQAGVCQAQESTFKSFLLHC